MGLQKRGMASDPSYLEPRVSQLEVAVNNQGTAPTTNTLKHGLSVITTDDASETSVALDGRTLVNLLGRDGNFEKDTVTDGVADGWSKAPSGSFSIDTTNAKYGTRSQKITALSGDSSIDRYLAKFSVSVTSGKFYLFGVDFISDGTAYGYISGDNNSITAPASTTFKFSYVKFTASSNAIAIAMRNYSPLGSTGWVSFDGVRLYEITQAEYNLIDVDPAYTGDMLADKYPYVDGVKHVVSPMVTKQGKNLLPPFTDWTLHANAVVTESYKMTLNATGAFQSTVIIVPVLPNQTYTTSCQATGSGVGLLGTFRDANKATISSINSGSFITSVTFTTPSNCYFVEINASSNAVGTYTYSNPQLELGSTATTFEPQNVDYIYGASDSTGKSLTLASSVDGTVKDSLYYRDGKWLKEKRWVTDVLLDGAQAWTSAVTDYTGYKSIRINAGSIISYKPNNYGGTKFNGMPVVLASSSATTTPDSYYFDASGNFIVGVNDTDTGFGETYTPTASDIAAYFNGWKMCDNTFAAYSTGTKYWTAVDSPKSDFAGKVAGSTVENPHSYGRYGSGTTLQTPSSFVENAQGDFNSIMYLDGSIRTYATTGSGLISQERWSFNLIEHVLRKYGSAVFGAAVTTVDRVAWLKANVGKLMCNWWGFGSSPLGNKAYLRAWNGSTWGVFSDSNTSSTPTKLFPFTTSSASISTMIDASGFVHFLAYADSSDGVTASTINTDFVELEVNLLVTTLPTGYATLSWTPYKLSYQLATTVEEVVNVEGVLNMHNGGNQIDVQEGVVVREKVVPYYYAGGLSYYINDESFPMTLKNKDDKILAIYKNGVLDKKWSVRPGGGTQPWGKQKASLVATDYDTTAEYTVTYTLLDKYANTAALNNVAVSYETVLKTAVDHAVRRLGDVETSTTINVRAIAELYKRMKALGG